MRGVTGSAPLSLERSMFVCKRALFVAVTLDAACVGADRQLDLFCFKPAVRIVTVAAFHRPFQNLVMKRLGKLRLCFRVAAHAELRFARF